MMAAKPTGVTRQSGKTPGILISGVGNVLQQDDGFGIAVVRELKKRGRLPQSVTLQETGIGGIHLVQELYNGYEVLIIVDAVMRDGQPGQIYFLEPQVPDISDLTENEQRDFLADMHYTNPSKALMLAKALGILPPTLLIVGCQPAAYDDFQLGLSDTIAAAVPGAAREIENWVKNFYTQKHWPCES